MLNHSLFCDWTRFCWVLREIARGASGAPLSGLEAQKRAQAVLAECGYAWWRDITPGTGVEAARRIVDPRPRKHSSGLIASGAKGVVTRR
jgi:hypothetical protein